MSRVILFPHKKIFVSGISFGPAIRFFQMAKALQRRGHNVSIAEKERKDFEDIENIKFIPWDDRLLNKIEKNYDCAIVDIWSSEQLFLERLNNIPLAIDVSAPVVVEHSNSFSTSDEHINHFFNDVYAPSTLMLQKGDFFICANKEQKLFYLGILSALGMINPFTRDDELFAVVPTAAPSEKPKITGNILKGILFDKKKEVILWPGGLLPWYDYKTVIDAVNLVIEKHPDSVLVFLGSKSPRAPQALTNNQYKKAIKYAKEKGLLNKHVFFIDWLPYNKRANAYFESEFAVVTSKKCLENELSFRTRVIDCLWGGLPVICTEGNSVSELVLKNQLGKIVSFDSVGELKDSIIDLLENKNKLLDFKRNIALFLKSQMNWDTVIVSLDKFCKNPRKLASNKRVNVLSLLNERIEHLREKENVINEKQRMICLLRDRVEEEQGRFKNFQEVNNEQIDSFKKELLKKDKELKKCGDFINREIRKRDGSLQQLNNELMKKDGSLQQLNNELMKKDGSLQQLNNELMKKDGSLQQLNNELTKKDKHIKLLQDRLGLLESTIAEKDKTLDQIFNSKAWKIIRKLDKFTGKDKQGQV